MYLLSSWTEVGAKILFNKKKVLIMKRLGTSVLL